MELPSICPLNVEECFVHPGIHHKLVLITVSAVICEACFRSKYGYICLTDCIPRPHSTESSDRATVHISQDVIDKATVYISQDATSISSDTPPQCIPLPPGRTLLIELGK